MEWRERKIEEEEGTSKVVEGKENRDCCCVGRAKIEEKERA